MNRTALYAGLLMGSAVFGQQYDTGGDGFFSPVEWTIIKTLSPLPDLPVDTSNRLEILHTNKPETTHMNEKSSTR
jgi:hypothetical protein